MDGFRKILAALSLLVASSAGAEVIREQVDHAHERVWTLTRDGVVVRDAASSEGRLVALDGWIWARAPWSCAPDIALGPAGEVLVTSNVMPVLWRIDPRTLAVTRHEVVLDADQGRDIGFSALTWSPRLAAFFAASATEGTLWRIDPLLRRAQKIPLSEPVAGACRLGVQPVVQSGKVMRLVSFCVRTPEASRRIDLAPDQRTGYVRVAACELD